MTPNEKALLLACKQLLQLMEEVLPQAGKLVFQDYGLLNNALINADKAIKQTEDT